MWSSQGVVFLLGRGGLEQEGGRSSGNTCKYPGIRKGRWINVLGNLYLATGRVIVGCIEFQ